MAFSGIIGMANSVSQSSGFGLGAVMPMQCVAWLSTGTGLSGIVVNLGRVAALIIYGSETDEEIQKGAILYFVISGVLVGTAIVAHRVFSSTEFFKY